MSERAAVLVDGIKKRFGSVTALDGVSFEVRRGTVLGLLGPNGAGKTTAVRILTTLLQPDEGRAEVEGFDVVTQTDDIRKRIGLAGQNAAVDENLTGRENIELVGRLYHLPKVEAKRRAQRLLERFDLVEAADRTVRTYSGGMRRRLDLGASLVGEPTVLFLDEPTTGSRPAQSHRPVGRSSASWCPRGRRCCSRRSTSKRPTSSPTVWSSSITAGSSPPALPTS